MPSRLTLLALPAALALVAGCQTPSSKSSEASAAATWKGGSVTTAELDAETYDQRKQALDGLVFKKLVDQKAKDAGVSTEELFKREVQAKVKSPSDAEAQAFYDEQSKQRQLPPFETIKDQIVRYLEGPQLQQAQQAFVEGLKKEYGVKTNLRPPRFDVAADGPSKGPANAKVTIVEFSDFECPYCSRAEETVNEVLKAYEGKVRVVYRDFPLPMHTNAGKAAEAAHCAGDQGKYWEMHGKLFQNQQALGIEALKGYAKELGLDAGKFDGCLDKGEKASVVKANHEAGEKLGISGTPVFYVNGYRLTGAQPAEEFKALIDAELGAK